jgi:hypothetical protein
MSANTPLNNIFADPNIAAINILSGGPISLRTAEDALNHWVAKITNASINATQTGTLYLPPRDYTISANVTIPEGVKLYLEHGATLNVASGKTLTVNGGYTGSGTFGGEGTVVLKNVEKIDVRDFGVKLNDSEGYGAEMNKALDAAGAVTYGSGTVTRGAMLYVPPGYINIDETLDFTGCRGIMLSGSKFKAGSAYWSQSTLKGTMTTSALIDMGSANNDNILIENLTLAGSTSSTSGADLDNHAIYGSGVTALNLRGLNIHGWGGCAVKLVSSSIAFRMFESQATGCLYGYLTGNTGGTALDFQTGVVHVEGSEPFLEDININGVFA